MRILVAIEPLAYREAIGSAIGGLRPHAEVVIAEPEDLEQQVARHEPQLVICGQPDSAAVDARAAWIEYHPYHNPAATVCLDGRRSELKEIGLEDLLSVVDDTERLSHTKSELGGGR